MRRTTRTAIPDAAAVREARAGVTAAATRLSRARARLATRAGEEAAAREQASASASALRAGLLAAALPDDCDTGALANAVGGYRSAAERWLHAGIDQLWAEAAAHPAHADRPWLQAWLADERRTGRMPAGPPAGTVRHPRRPRRPGRSCRSPR